MGWDGFMNDLKTAVHDHWTQEICGTRGFESEDRRQFLTQMEANRYRVQPFIPAWADFKAGAGRSVLEIGVGGGVDHANWARAGAVLHGIDLTEAGLNLTRERLAREHLTSDLRVADAENLPFENNCFDIVYSYGVLHHSPNTKRCFEEVHRVLRPGGTARIMVYSKYSFTAFNVWLIQCLAKGRPWKGLAWACFHYLESPGTKVYSRRGLGELLAPFSEHKLQKRLLGGDTLEIVPSQKYRAGLFGLIWKLYPTRLVRRFGAPFGTAWLIEVKK